MKKRLIYSLIAAAVLWFVMFSPWTRDLINFWVAMTLSAILLTYIALSESDVLSCLRCYSKRLILEQIGLGLLIATVLWAVFWIGDKVSQWLFDFARPQVDMIYNLRSEMKPGVIAALLLLIIGPAEEFFWRGYVQESLSRIFSRKQGKKMGAISGFLVALLIYTLIHIWSGNLMLILAAFVAGVMWGALYLFRPDWLLAIVVSHAVWDAAVFIFFPIFALD